MSLSLTVPNVRHLYISLSLEEGIHFGCRDKTVAVPLACILSPRIFCSLPILPVVFNALWFLDTLHHLVHVLGLLLPSPYGSHPEMMFSDCSWSNSMT